MGNSTISATGGTAKNYNFSYANNGKLSITKAPLCTVTTNNATRVYGDANPTFTAAISGFKLGQNEKTAGIFNIAPSYSTTAVPASDVGNYAITGNSNADAKNYSFNYTNGTLKITKANLTITSNASRAYGDDNPTRFTPTFG